MSLRHLVGSLLILAASLTPCLGQTRPNARATFAVEGYVRDETNEQPMQNIRVDLREATGLLVNFTVTQDNGAFDFNGLGRGDYIIEVSIKDYEVAQQKVSISGLDVRGVYIYLRRLATVTQTRTGATISAHELSVPSKPHEEYLKGMNLMYGKLDYTGAIGHFQRAIKDFPTFYEAYAQEGYAYLQIGQMAPAEEAIRKSVELSSGQYSTALFMLSGLLTDTKRYSDAETFARKGIAIDGGFWQGPFELTRALFGLGQMEEAEKCAIQSRDMKPDNPSVYLMLANIFIHQHQYPELVKDLDAYLKLVPSGPEAEQARKTKDDVQAALQKQQDMARASAEQTANQQTQNQPKNEPPPPAEPDTSGLPSLAPPASNP